MFKFTAGQMQRLLELGAIRETTNKNFMTTVERGGEFNRLVKHLTNRNLETLENYLSKRKRLLVRIVEGKLSSTAIATGFTEVTTHIIIPKDFIKRMRIREGATSGSR